MKKALAAAVALLIAAQARAGLAPCTFRVHVTANANDTAVFAQRVRLPSGREVYLERTPWLTERNVTSFSVYRAADGSYGALLQLDDHGRTILDTLSVERRGSYLFVLINGRPLTELQIDRRVSDGQIYLPSGLTEGDIKSMAKAWRLIRSPIKK